MRTGRPSISDAEKQRRGTADPRFTEAARAERAGAKVVNLYPSEKLDQVPEPPADLSDQAKQDYYSKARRLHETGRLTQTWADKTVLFAIRRHGILLRLSEARSPKEADMKACEAYLREFQAMGIEAPLNNAGAPASKFAIIGFASRGKG